MSKIPSIWTRESLKLALIHLAGPISVQVRSHEPNPCALREWCARHFERAGSEEAVHPTRRACPIIYGAGMAQQQSAPAHNGPLCWA